MVVELGDGWFLFHRNVYYIQLVKFIILLIICAYYVLV